MQHLVDLGFLNKTRYANVTPLEYVIINYNKIPYEKQGDANKIIDLIVKITIQSNNISRIELKTYILSKILSLSQKKGIVDVSKNILNNKIFSITKSTSFDRNDFAFIYEKIKNMSLEESLATLAIIYSKQLIAILKRNKINPQEIILCGGGRKNLGIKMALKQEISNFNKEQNCNIIVKDSNEYQINGDAIEAEAFAFLAIRSARNLPISFKNTSGVDIDSCKGGGFYNFN